MKAYPFFKLLTLFIVLLSCESKAEKQKAQAIAQSIAAMQHEMDTTRYYDSETVQTVNLNSAQADQIIGVWEMKNDYGMGIYEIEKREGAYVGKIHYYNDGNTEYTAKGDKSDYFLSAMHYEDGVYKKGRLYMPDGLNYEVLMTLKTIDELELKMTLDGEPYTETWKRQKTD
ncbi:MAG: hypothetical protein AAFX55_04535 [Bacteroidota bacterium]